MIRPVLRYDNQMRMRHAITMNDHANGLWLENATHAPTDLLRHEQDPLRELIVEISEMINMILRYDEALAGRSGTKRHEGHHGLILKDHARRGLATDDLTENALHGRIGTWTGCLTDCA